MAEKIAWGLLSVVLAVAAITDCRCGKIFNWLTYPAMLVGLAYWACVGLMTAGPAGAGHECLRSLLAAAAGLIPCALIVAAGGLGGGDVKLMGAVGALSASWQCVLGTAFYGLLLAALMAIVVMIRRHLVGRTLRRMLGVALTAALGAKPEVPPDSPRIPLALPLAIGGILAGAEWLLHKPMPWGGG